MAFTPHLLIARLGAALLLGLSVLLATAPAASAACHIAAFDGQSFDTGEGQMVTITVVLQGRQPSCEGTVDYSTQDGTATAGDDYDPIEGKLTFIEGDDREETITIAIRADDEDEPSEDFLVMLTGGTEGISASSGVATVTIADGGGDSREQAIEDGALPDEAVPSIDDGTSILVPVDPFNTTPIIVAVIALAVIGGAAFLLRGRGGA